MARGQAAMEFIMTYGWAILVIMVAISALAYFGVMTPSNSTPERCTVPPGIGCSDYKVLASAESTQLQLTLRNALGESIVVTGFEANTTKTATDLSCGYPIGAINADEPIVISCNMTGAAVGASTPTKIQFTMKYKKADGTYNHAITGEVYSRAEKVACVVGDDCPSHIYENVCVKNVCVVSGGGPSPPQPADLN